MAVTQATETTGMSMSSIREAFQNGSLESAAGNSGTSSEESPSDRNEAIISEWKPTEEGSELATPETDLEQTTSNETNLAAQTKTETPLEDIETFWVKDETGKKRKLDIEYKDRAKIKDAFIKAAGMRKFQAERDAERKEKAELKAKHEAITSDFNKLDNIFKEKGAKGLFEQLGGPGAWDKAIDDELRHRDYLLNLSPAEKIKMEKDEAETRAHKSQAELEKKYQAALDKIDEADKHATLKSLEARIHPAFEKNRFKGKLGDPEAEHALDLAVWTQVQDRLAEYPEDTEITQAIADKEFRTVANTYRKVLDKQADSRLKVADSKQKASAAERVQLAVKKGMTSNTIEADIANDIKTSNWSSLLQKAANGKFK